MPNPPAHTFLAYRVLARPSPVRPEFREQCKNFARDLTQEIIGGLWDPCTEDVDGTPLLTLALQDWVKEAFVAAPIVVDGVVFPRVRASFVEPGGAWRDLGGWEEPAAAMIWRGASPFSNWPESFQPLDIPETAKRCPFFTAVTEDAASVVKQSLLLPHAPSAEQMNAIGESEGLGILDMVCKSGSNDMLQQLLKHGLNPNRPGVLGRTPLFHAQTEEQASALLDAGADPHVLDTTGQGVLDYWSSVFRDPSPLVEAWIADGYCENDQSPNIGEAIAALVPSNSLRKIATWLQYVPWTLENTISPARPHRLLSEAAHVMVRNARPAQPLNSALVLDLLVKHNSIWTKEEKTEAILASQWVLALNKKMGWSFADGSLNTAKQVLDEFRPSSEMKVRVAPLLLRRVLLAPYELEPSSEITYWAVNAWLHLLPMNEAEVGWETLRVLGELISIRPQMLGEISTAPLFRVLVSLNNSSMQHDENSIRGLLWLRAEFEPSAGEEALTPLIDDYIASAWKGAGVNVAESFGPLEALLNNEDSSVSRFYRKALLEVQLPKPSASGVKPRF